MRPNITIAHVRFTLRHIILAAGFVYVILAQQLPAWGEYYARHLYPTIGHCLSFLSQLIPFELSGLFYALSIMGLILYLFHSLFTKKRTFWQGVLGIIEYLLWLYVWFYLAWGLNYSQQDFYKRTGITPTEYSEAAFLDFARSYVEQLNANYTDSVCTDKAQISTETVAGYHRISQTLGVHPPFHEKPRAKTMLFTPLASLVGVTGSMGPFLGEFTLNGDLPATQYPATYAHEFSHLLGITSEAEANFYAYLVCTHSDVQPIRFSGYLSILPHVLSNASRLLEKAEYQQLLKSIRPEVINLYQLNRAHWQAKYSPLIGSIQDWFYDLYLKGNKIPDGRKNYSQVIRLLMAYEYVLIQLG